MLSHSKCPEIKFIQCNVKIEIEAMSPSALSPVKNNHLSYQHGHSFIKKNFHKPTNCHYCSELLWGLMGQGYTCEGKLISIIILLRRSFIFVHVWRSGLGFLKIRYSRVELEGNC